MTFRIANGAGFLGDDLDAPRRLLAASCSAGIAIDCLTLEYLAELTMSILARLREKDPAAGFAQDFLTVLDSLLPHLAAQPALKLVTNAGGMNPRACAVAAGRLLLRAGMGHVPLGVVTGDDLLPRLAELQAAGCDFAHFDTGQPLRELQAPVVSANAYLGGRPIADCLAAGAQHVITGRVADASLTVGPAAHHYAWSWNDWHTLANASVAGHLIECGAQATGGFYTHWRELNLNDIGYPLAEIAASGESVLTMPPGAGGRVSRETVCEQLVYEIADPAHYLTPDVDVDFTGVTAEEVGSHRVAVRGARGAPPPATIKVSLAYRAGFMASATMLCYGPWALEKARTCAELVQHRLRAAGFNLEHFLAEYLGAGSAVPLAAPDPQAEEIVLRLTVRDARRDAVERFTRELAPLATAGPAGLAGYASGRAQVREVFAYWPTRIPRDLITTQVEVRPAKDWAA